MTKAELTTELQRTSSELERVSAELAAWRAAYGPAADPNLRDQDELRQLLVEGWPNNGPNLRIVQHDE